jgi:hypothetical protein
VRARDCAPSVASRSGVSRTATSVEHGGGYLRGGAAVAVVRSLVGSASRLHVRLYGGGAQNAPSQRAVYASTQDPFETFTNDLFRSRAALLKQRGINYLPLGGAGLRGYRFDTPLDGVGAVNGEVVQRLAVTRGKCGRATFSFSIFGDAGVASSKSLGESKRSRRRRRTRRKWVVGAALGDYGRRVVVASSIANRTVARSRRTIPMGIRVTFGPSLSSSSSEPTARRPQNATEPSKGVRPVIVSASSRAPDSDS